MRLTYGARRSSTKYAPPLLRLILLSHPGRDMLIISTKTKLRAG